MSLGMMVTLLAWIACKQKMAKWLTDCLTKKNGNTYAKIGVLEKTNKVGLASLLKGHDGGALEAEIGLEVLGDLTDKTLEGQLADQELGGLLVTTDLTESDGSGPVTVRFLHASCGRGGLPRSLGGKLLARGLSSGGFTGGLFCSGHCVRCSMNSE